ncbi:MAG: LPS assembly lipoprotein LptE [Planctomycetaceae bacterium]|nr:LPS assembly lipoprotein LptE [Planctomycetaceae bacterium]
MLFVLSLSVAAMLLTALGGCAGYQNGWVYPQNVQTVYVEMFDTKSFRRGFEFTLTDAICKRIEAQTPYKIVSDRERADTVLSGDMVIRNMVVAMDRYTGRPLEFESAVGVIVTWKDLKTGKLLVDRQEVMAVSSYSSQLGQNIDYSISLAANKAAVRVVELMEIPW